MKNQMHPRGEEEAKNKVNRSSHQTPECIKKPKGIVMTAILKNNCLRRMNNLFLNKCNVIQGGNILLFLLAFPSSLIPVW
jgi:hypothetical protein